MGPGSLPLACLEQPKCHSDLVFRRIKSHGPLQGSSFLVKCAQPSSVFCCCGFSEYSGEGEEERHVSTGTSRWGRMQETLARVSLHFGLCFTCVPTGGETRKRPLKVKPLSLLCRQKGRCLRDANNRERKLIKLSYHHMLTEVCSVRKPNMYLISQKQATFI